MQQNRPLKCANIISETGVASMVKHANTVTVTAATECTLQASRGKYADIIIDPGIAGGAKHANIISHSHSLDRVHIAGEPRKRCRQYYESGGRHCRFGRSCKYRHIRGSGSSDEFLDVASHVEHIGGQSGGYETSPVIARQGLCIVCTTGPLEVVYSMCGHVSLCQSCSDTSHASLDKCPVCQLTSGRVRIRLCGI